MRRIRRDDTQSRTFLFFQSYMLLRKAGRLYKIGIEDSYITLGKIVSPFSWSYFVDTLKNKWHYYLLVIAICVILFMLQKYTLTTTFKFITAIVLIVVLMYIFITSGKLDKKLQMERSKQTTISNWKLSYKDIVCIDRITSHQLGWLPIWYQKYTKWGLILRVNDGSDHLYMFDDNEDTTDFFKAITKKIKVNEFDVSKIYTYWSSIFS